MPHPDVPQHAPGEGGGGEGSGEGDGGNGGDGTGHGGHNVHYKQILYKTYSFPLF